MNENNLIPQSERTKSEQREIARMGGIASGIARREKKQFRELLESAFAREIIDDGEKMTLKAIAMKRLAEDCAHGKTKSIELALKVLGELVEKQEIEYVVPTIQERVVAWKEEMKKIFNSDYLNKEEITQEEITIFAPDCLP